MQAKPDSPIFTPLETDHLQLYLLFRKLEMSLLFKAIKQNL